MWNKEELTELYCKKGMTLAEIGKVKGVTRERVRQCMELYKIPRDKHRPHTIVHPRYKSLEDYLYKSTAKNPSNFFRKYKDLFKCAECGSTQHLHFHHIIYPAKSLEDIQPLCCSCHVIKHRGKVSLVQQVDLYLKYQAGATASQLSKEYNISIACCYVIVRKLKNGWHTTRG